MYVWSDAYGYILITNQNSGKYLIESCSSCRVEQSPFKYFLNSAHNFELFQKLSDHVWGPDGNGLSLSVFILWLRRLLAS